MAAPLTRRLRSIAAALVAGAVVSLLPAASARCADHPVSGDFLALRARASGAEVKLVTRDPAFPFPTPGSDDDPATEPYGGLVVEIFTAGEGAFTIEAPAGLGKPGWRRGSGGIRTLRFAGDAGDLVRKVLLREARLFRLNGAAGLPLEAPLGAAAVRVTMGWTRACALFDGASVRRDVPGRFVARKAPAPSIPDCSDETLEAALGFDCGEHPWGACGGGDCPGDGACVSGVVSAQCECAYPTQPCGVTAPACNGQCPAGQTCFEIDDFIPGEVNACLCAPAGEPPCGTSGLSCAEGTCPEGLECSSQPGGGIYDPSCVCSPPAATCGPGFGTCPPDLQCLFVPQSGYQCVPTFCGGSFPTCGGSGCGPNAACVPLSFGGSGSGSCVCASLDSSCDSPTCGGGLYCPAGEVCTVDAGSCSCEPLVAAANCCQISGDFGSGVSSICFDEGPSPHACITVGGSFSSGASCVPSGAPCPPGAPLESCVPGTCVAHPG